MGNGNGDGREPRWIAKLPSSRLAAQLTSKNVVNALRGYINGELYDRT